MGKLDDGKIDGILDDIRDAQNASKSEENEDSSYTFLKWELNWLKFELLLMPFVWLWNVAKSFFGSIFDSFTDS